MRGILLSAAAGTLVLLVACGSSSNKTNNSSNVAVIVPSQTVASQPVAATVLASATPGTRLTRATPATNPVSRINGTVQSVSGSTVTMSDGTSFTLAPQTAVTVRKPGTAASIRPGNVVAITAKQQPDNTLLASMIVVFPAAPGGGNFFGQRPLDGGNLMTNATVEKVSSTGFSATFPGGSANVTLAPNAQVQLLGSGTAADITPGAMISAAVSNGAAQSVTVQ